MCPVSLPHTFSTRALGVRQEPWVPPSHRGGVHSGLVLEKSGIRVSRFILGEFNSHAQDGVSPSNSLLGLPTPSSGCPSSGRPQLWMPPGSGGPQALNTPALDAPSSGRPQALDTPALDPPALAAPSSGRPPPPPPPPPWACVSPTSMQRSPDDLLPMCPSGPARRCPKTHLS